MVFYKYAGGFGIRILEDLRLKITRPNEFNDPFELTPRSKFTLTVADMLDRARTNPDHYRGAFESMKRDGYQHTFEQFIADFPKRPNFKKFRKLMREALVQEDMKSLVGASEKFGILCLSQISNSIPMWSHYADHHKGIAVGLDVAKIGQALGPFRRVRYCKQRRGIDRWLPPTNPEWFRQILDTFFVKSREWTYEQEYRRVFQLARLVHAQPDEKGKRHFFLDIRGTDVREIVFGCRIDETFENRIRAELRRRPKTFGHVKLFRCKRHRSRFELEIIPC